MLLAVGRHLAETHDSYDGVLIPGMGSGQAAVALLQAEYIIVAAAPLEELDLLADELEACEHFDQFHAIGPGDGPGHVGGNDGGHQCRIFRHFPGCGTLP